MGLSDLSEVESKVLNQLQGVVDPELGSDIVDLGMVKGVDHHHDGHVLVTVALTTSGALYALKFKEISVRSFLIFQKSQK